MLIALCLLLLIACGQEDLPGIDPIPQIELLETAPLAVVEYQDSIVFVVKYTDGDGDLGSNDDSERNVFLADSRVAVTHTFRLQQLAPGGAGVPITGTFRLTLPATILTDPTSSEERVRFLLSVVDQAGNESNAVESPEIVVRAQ
jgi:hypothetical protein